MSIGGHDKAPHRLVGCNTSWIDTVIFQFPIAGKFSIGLFRVEECELGVPTICSCSAVKTKVAGTVSKVSYYEPVWLMIILMEETHMRVCIIGGSNLRFMPYLRYYESLLKEADVDYDVYYWNRFGIEENHPNAASFDRPDGGNARNRFRGYLAYRRFLLNQLERRRYDTYIVLTMQVGVILSDFLSGRRYILDIRDYSHEGFLPYRSIGRRLVRESLLTCISSKAFETWLPPGTKYRISHNVLLEDLDMSPSAFNAETRIVSFIGIIHSVEPNVRFLNAVRNIPYLQVRYVGTGPCQRQLQNYCSDAGIENVQFLGPFSPESRLKYFQDTNFVLSCFGSASINARTCMPNRLYDSCVCRRPIIVDDGTYLAKIVRENGIGIVAQLDDSARLASQLAKYYKASHYSEYVSNCHDYLSLVEEDINSFRTAVRQTILEV